MTKDYEGIIVLLHLVDTVLTHCAMQHCGCLEGLGRVQMEVLTEGGVKQEKAEFQIYFQLPRYSSKITQDKSDTFRIRPSSKPGEGAVLTFDNVPAWILLTVMSLLLGKGH